MKAKARVIYDIIVYNARGSEVCDTEIQKYRFPVMYKINLPNTDVYAELPVRYTHTQPFYCSSGICPGPPGWAGTRKVKPGR